MADIHDVLEDCTGCAYNRDALCKRWPPTHGFDPMAEEMVLHGQPPVDPDGWCGEFKRGTRGQQ